MLEQEKPMPELWQLTRLIRSKNAGPFELTFDLIFKDREGFDLVKKSGIVSAKAISKLYSVPVDEVRVFQLPAILALKISIPRPAFSGDLDDTDVYGGQFHSPLVRLQVGENRAQPT
jgi:uncharacterized protein DUF4387